MPPVDAGPGSAHAGVMTAPVDELMQSAVKARQRAQSALVQAVREARAADWSWEAGRDVYDPYKD